jgi:hypothetical protein
MLSLPKKILAAMIVLRKLKEISKVEVYKVQK